MLANPTHFAANLTEWPLTWQGAALDPFTPEFAGLRLTDKDSLHTLRSLIYTMNADTLTADDIVDYTLIRQMRSFWDRSTELDTKYAVVDAESMGTPESFEKAAAGETNWFVLNDKVFLDGRDPAEMSLLEVGCGHGRLLKHLAKRFREVHGADGSPMRFMEARFRFRDVPNVRITQTDGRSLRQYADNSFDRSFAHGVFVHIHSRTVIESYIREMARVTRQGGLVKFDIYHGKGYFGASPWFYGYGARFSEDDIKAVFVEAGVELVKIDYEMHVQYARGVDKEQSGLPLKQMLVTGRVL
ncbi:MAG: class I SAM-dependent methyltransferase [Thermodesulfobacteriota bacterium]